METKKDKELKRSGERIYALNKNYFFKKNVAKLNSFADYSYVFKCGKE